MQVSKKLLRARARAAETIDVNFENNILLIHADGTDGATTSTYIDEGRNSMAMTVTGQPAQGTFNPYMMDGYYNVAFDGSDALTIPANNAVSAYGTGSYTIECFVNFAALPAASGSYYIFDQRGASTSNTAVALSLFNNAGTYRFEMRSGTTTGFTANFTPSVGLWYHIALCRDSGTIRLFVNGSQIGSVASSANLITSFITYLGAATGTGSFLIGYISNFRILKGTGLYTAAFTPPSSPLLAITNTTALLTCCHRFRDLSSINSTIGVIGNPLVKIGGPFNPTTSLAVNYGSGYFDANLATLSYITSTSIADINLSTSNFTIECWVYCTAYTATNAIIFDQRNGITNSNAPLIYITSTGILNYYVNGVNRITGNALPIGQWTHIAVTRSNSAHTMYVNGVSVGTWTSSTTYVQGPFRIGCDNDGTPSGMFVGYITGVKVVKGSVLYTGTFTPSMSPPTADANTILLLNFKNASIKDATGKNNFTTVGNARIATAVKKFGTASMFFDGTGDDFEAPFQNDWYLGTGNWTLEYWCYPTTVASAIRRHISIEETNNAIVIRQNSSAIQAFLRLSNTTGPTITGSTNFTANTWQHIALVRNGTTITLYKDGVSIGSITGQSGALGFSTATLVIGSSNNAEYYTGYIDEVRFTKGIARYTAAFTPPTKEFPSR